MKKKIITIIVLALIVSSCAKDENSKAKMDYYGLLSSVEFTDETDEERMYLIVEALNKLKLTDTSSIFREEATSDGSDILSAIIACNSKAVKTYRARIGDVDHDIINTTIYEAHTDSFNNIGINSPSDLPFSSFTVNLELHSATVASEPIEKFQLYY